MKEKIYTIPVNEVFATDCECPLCLLEQRIENESIEYILGPSLMEPDSRIESNIKGFCHSHFDLLFGSRINMQGLGLITETHLAEQIKMLKKSKDAENLNNNLKKLEKSCMICDKINFTMSRYIDVIFYLWLNEPDFRDAFNNGKGFCLKHFRTLIKGTKKYLKPKIAKEFMKNLVPIQIENMERIEKEIAWFNKKSDYRFADEPWGNSKDSVARSIQKITGFTDFK
jgi:hypothetical protein